MNDFWELALSFYLTGAGNGTEVFVPETFPKLILTFEGILFIMFIYLLCMDVPQHVYGVRGQGAGSLFMICGSWGLNSDCKLGRKCLYHLSLQC